MGRHLREAARGTGYLRFGRTNSIFSNENNKRESLGGPAGAHEGRPYAAGRPLWPPCRRGEPASSLLVERGGEQLAAFAEVVERGLQLAQFVTGQPLQRWRPEVA
jgi:hypothetical protein